MKRTLRQIRLSGRVRLEFAEQGPRGGPAGDRAARSHRFMAFVRGLIGGDFSARLRDLARFVQPVAATSAAA